MANFLAQVKALWAKLGTPQRIAGGVLIGIVLILGIGASLLGSSKEYRSLVTGAERAEIQKLLLKLDEAGLPYRLSGDGRNVEVVASRWEEVQRIIVSNDLLSSGRPKGYSGLGDIPFGRTDAQLKLELKKAQEEQLALTLERFEDIEEAVVHITPPSRGISRQETRPGKASVMIRTRPGRMLPSSQVEAVVQLVSHAVDGLLPENVAVTDFRGILLSRPDGAGRASIPGAVLGREVGEALQEKIESALAQALGHDKAVVRVEAEIDLEKTDTTRRTVDPETKVVMSETQRSSQNTATEPKGRVSTAATQADANRTDASGSSTEDSEQTYRYGESEVRTVKEMGQIRRLTVGVLVDDSLKDQRESIEGMVKGAVGFNQKRGDLIQISFVPFAVPPPVPVPAEPSFLETDLFWQIVRWGITAIVGFGLIWFVLRSAKTAKAGLRQALEKVESEKQTQIVMARKPDPKEEVKRLVESDVESVSKILRNWLYEPAKR